MAKKPDKDRYIYKCGFRIRKSDGLVVSLMYYDQKTKKNRRISYDPDPKVQNKDEMQYYLPRYRVKRENLDNLERDAEFKKALKFKESFNSQLHSKYARAKARIKWMSNFKIHEVTLLKFENWRKQKSSSPNNWENDVLNLKNHVFPFFLEEQGATSHQDWVDLHVAFKDWLRERNTIKETRGSEKLSVNTMNNIIRSLNAFYTFLEHNAAKNKTRVKFERCKSFPKNEGKRLGIEAVISEDTLELLRKHLSGLSRTTQGGKVVADSQRDMLLTFFETLLMTGMRKNEALGISLKDIKFGKSDLEEFGYIEDTLRELNIDSYGYIFLESQPALESIRDSKGSVPRKSLKMKKEIDSLNSRYIPLLNKEVTDRLIDLAQKQVEAFKEQKYGSDLGDYLLFDGLGYNSLNGAFNKIYRHKDFEKIHKFYPHHLRHTWASTWIYKLRGKVEIISKIVGHTRAQVTERYLHLYREKIAREDILGSLEEIENLKSSSKLKAV